MNIEITPQPSDDERAAIAAAIAEEAEEPPSAWPATVLPGRDDPVDAFTDWCNAHGLAPM